MKTFSISLIVVLLAVTGCTDNKKDAGTLQSKVHSEKPEVVADTSELSLNYLEPLHKRKTFKRYDKSFPEYVKSNPNKPDSIRKIIYLLPLGNMRPEVEEIIKGELEYLKRFFQLDVRILDRVPFDEIKNKKVETRFLSRNDYEYYSKIKGESVDLTEQIEANSLIANYVKENIPDSAVAVLGITEHDLYIPKMNYIFGTSYLKNKVGLISTYRIAEYSYESKVNIRKVVTKQIANLFSIPNVKDYQCVLNFHNSLNELRDGVLYISPKALEKLKYSIGFDHDKRFKELKEFYHNEKNVKMEDFYDKCLKLKEEKDTTVSKS